MRQSRLASAPAYAQGPDLKHIISRNLAGFAGLVVIVAVVGVTVALATWNVADPSLSHATSAAARNRLGYPGAVVADLAMQLIGLASGAMLLPALAIGWRLMLSGEHGLSGGRVAWWIIGTLSVAAALAGLSLPLGWPLPVGLGGALGDMILRLPAAAMGGQELGRLVSSLAFACLGLSSLWMAASPSARSETGVKKPSVSVDDLDFDRDEVDEPRMFSLPLAMVHHWFLVARANVLRLVGRRSLMLDARGYSAGAGSGRRVTLKQREAFDEDDDADFSAMPRRVIVRGRQEPAFERPQPRSRVAAPASVGAEDDDDSYLDDPIPSSFAPTQPVRATEPRREATRRTQPAPEPEPLVAYDDEFVELDEDEEPPAAAPSRVVRGVAQPQPAPVVAPVAVPVADRRVAVGAQPRQIVQEKRPGGRMEVQGPGPSGYQMPSLALLSEPKRLGPNDELSEEVLEGNAGVLEGVLDDFGIKGEICHVRPGPVVTLYELEPAAGVKSSRVIGLADDIARSMSAISARVAVVPGRNVIGIELPNQRRETVYLRELLASQDFGSTKHKLAFCLGKTIGGEPVIVDLARMPHLLVAGTTGSGKSVAINTMILSLLYRLTPQQCKLIMIDPKMLELSVYDNIPHLLCPVVTDPKKAVVALKWTVREMEDRYKKMSKLGVRNIDGFNARVIEANARGEVLTREIQTGFHRLTGEPVFEQEELALEPLPYIVVIVDEMADLMLVAGKEIEGAIQRLAQMARAAGIHIVMATQRPSVDVITGTIKANFPTRISFQVTSKIDSRTILAEQGAEQLLGQGDMLYMAGGGRIQRVHGPFVSDDEVEKVVAHLKKQGAPQYLDAITAGDEEDAAGDGDAGGLEDSTDLYDKAVAVVLRDKKPSTSYVQRRLQIGYNRAASLIERMEKEGIVSAPNQQGKREILVGSD